MKALISPDELVCLPDNTVGQRVAQVEPDDRIFPVAAPLYWQPCEPNVVADQFYWDGAEIKPVPLPPPPPPPTPPPPTPTPDTPA